MPPIGKKATGKYFIGIDPGVNGGVVILDGNGNTKGVHKMPETDKDIHLLLQPYKGNAMCCIERLYGHGGMQGSKASIFTQGKNYGFLMMSILANEFVVEEILPKKWQKFLTLHKDPTYSQTEWKNILKSRAQKLFPKQTVTLWSADALLIALYCYRNFK
jgi:hypothetical protein